MGLGIVKWVQKAGWKVSEREYPVFNAPVTDIATHPPGAAATRAGKADAYVIGLLAVPCLCNDCTFSGLGAPKTVISSEFSISTRNERERTLTDRWLPA